LLVDREGYVPNRTIDGAGRVRIECFLNYRDRVQDARSDCLDLDMNQDEPVLVEEVHEILNGVDVSERNRPVLVKSFPVVQSVTVIAQNRRTVQQLAGAAQRTREIGRQHSARFLAYLVDVGGGEEADAQIVQPEFRKVAGRHAIFGPQRDIQRARVNTKAWVLQETWK